MLQVSGDIMKITALMENTSSHPRFKSEHGLSLYIEASSHRILFDMGQSEAFADNAKELGIDLADVDIAILSHGHYDHGGGLAHFLKVNQKSKVYINKNAFLPHYNGSNKYIGLDVALRSSDRIVFTDDSYIIDENISLFTCNEKPRKHSFGSFGLTEKVGDDFIEDDFRHEQYLLITENEKRILFSGCSHKGIIDITDWFKPTALIGGFHFSKIPLGSSLLNAAEKLERFDTEYFTCHCTGKEQFDFMKQYISKLHYLSCGEVITI